MPKVPVEVTRADREIQQLARAFDYPVDGLEGHQSLALAFALRGWDLYRGVKHSLTGPSRYAPHVDLRALLEAAILTRWMELDPPLRSRLWLADDRRTQIRGQTLGTAFSEMRGTEPPRISDEDIADWKLEIEAARADARSAGIRDVPRTGRVLPSIESMTRSHDDLRETSILYWTLSPAAHAGGRSFAGDDLEVRDGRSYLVPKPFLRTDAALLGLAIPSLLMLWASVSRQVGIGIESECDALRMSVVFPSRFKL